MFTKPYQLLPQTDPSSFVRSDRFIQRNFHKGLSFDYIPKIAANDFTDTSQGWLSWICNLLVIFLVYVFTFLTFPISGCFVLKTVPNYQRIVVFRLGRICPPKGPGVVLVLPFIDQWQKVDLRTRAFNVPPCQVLTREGGTLLVGADIQFRIWNPVMSVVSVQDLNASTRMTAQNVLTHSLAKKTIQEIQAERLKLGEYLGVDINELTHPWGLEVDKVELTFGSLLRTPEYPQASPPPVVPPVRGLEGLPDSIQELARQFLGQGFPPPPQQADSLTFTDGFSRGSNSVVDNPASVEELLCKVQTLLSQSLVHHVGASFQFEVISNGQQQSYYLDLSQGSGAAGCGSLVRDPDVTLCMTDRDLLAMFHGELQPIAAYTSGRLKVQGDVSTAMKLGEVITFLKKELSK